jgi:hypothetical protein
VFYELGSYYFQQQVYPKALNAFTETQNIVKQVQGKLCVCSSSLKKKKTKLVL